jgi:Cu/Ag efflux pump CusA
VLAAVAAGGTLSFGSVIGLLAVFGLAARNAVLLIDHYQHLEHHESETFGTELVLRGARERVSGALATAVAAALVLLPIVIAGPIPGYEIVQPLAIVVLGGLVTSTLLTLFVIPALYLRLASNSEREKSVAAPVVPQAGS